MMVVPIDTCSTEHWLEKRFAKKVSRAVAPERAGREGVGFEKTDHRQLIEIMNQLKPFAKDFKNLTFTMKVYLKFPSIPGENAIFMSTPISIEQRENGSFHLQYAWTDKDDKYHEEDQDFDIPNGDLTDNDADSDDDWIELVGIKMRVQNRKKREISSKWMMLGIDLYVSPGKIGHFRVYINGKLLHNHELQADEYIGLEDLGPLVYHVNMGCIEYSRDVQDASYFEDLNLNECSKSS